MSNFQVKIGGQWQDYSAEEQRILKRAFMAGYPHAKFSIRGQNYEYDFHRMSQKNLGTDKEREIRPPHRWQAPSKPLVPPGRTTCVKVPPGSMGTTIQVPHPDDPREFISVRVPNSARPGQAMLVPVPPLLRRPGQSGGRLSASASGEAPSASPVPAAPDAKAGARRGWSTGAKVAAGTAAVAGGAALGVGAVVAGESIAEHGLEATIDAAGDGMTSAAEATGEALGDAFEYVVDGAEVAGDFIVDAAEHVGDFVMDLF